MRLTFCGVRGSTPAPGHEFAERRRPHVVRRGRPRRRSRHRRSCIDAGTGLRRLSERARRRRRSAARSCSSHLHWDHVQGLPFFAAGDRHDAAVRVLVPEQGRDPLDAARPRRCHHRTSRSRPTSSAGPGGSTRSTKAPTASRASTCLARDIPHHGGPHVRLPHHVGAGRSFAYLSDHAPHDLGAGARSGRRIPRLRRVELAHAASTCSSTTLNSAGASCRHAVVPRPRRGRVRRAPRRARRRPAGTAVPPRSRPHRCQTSTTSVAPSAPPTRRSRSTSPHDGLEVLTCDDQRVPRRRQRDRPRRACGRCSPASADIEIVGVGRRLRLARGRRRAEHAAERGRVRHPHAAELPARGHRRLQGDPQAPPRHRRRDPVAVRRPRLRDRAAVARAPRGTPTC